MSWDTTEKQTVFCSPGSKVSIELGSAGTDFWFDPSHAFCRCLVSYMDYRQTITSIHWGMDTRAPHGLVLMRFVSSPELVPMGRYCDPPRCPTPRHTFSTSTTWESDVPWRGIAGDHHQIDNPETSGTRKTSQFFSFPGVWTHLHHDRFMVLGYHLVISFVTNL